MRLHMAFYGKFWFWAFWALKLIYVFYITCINIYLKFRSESISVPWDIVWQNFEHRNFKDKTALICFLFAKYDSYIMNIYVISFKSVYGTSKMDLKWKKI